MGKKLYVVALVVMLVGYQMMPGRASSHREAPLISSDPQADNTDVYAFVSPDAPDTVTLIASFDPVRGSRGRPELLQVRRQRPVRDQDRQQRRRGRGHHLPVPLHVADREPEHVPLHDRPDQGARRSEPQPVPDLHGDARRERPHRASPPGRCGRCTTTSGRPRRRTTAATAAASTSSGRRTARSAASSPARPTIAFFLDLRVFDLLYGGEPVGDRHRHARRLQRPQHRDPGAEGVAARRAARSSASGRPPAVRRRRRARPASETTSGNIVQVSRLGMPLVNEVVIPLGQKDKWNGSIPTDDAQFLSYVTDPEVPKLLQAVYGMPRRRRRATISCRCS